MRENRAAYLRAAYTILAWGFANGGVDGKSRFPEWHKQIVQPLEKLHQMAHGEAISFEADGFMANRVKDTANVARLELLKRLAEAYPNGETFNTTNLSGMVNADAPNADVLEALNDDLLELLNDLVGAKSMSLSKQLVGKRLSTLVDVFIPTEDGGEMVLRKYGTVTRPLYLIEITGDDEIDFGY